MTYVIAKPAEIILNKAYGHNEETTVARIVEITREVLSKLQMNDGRDPSDIPENAVLNELERVAGNTTISVSQITKLASGIAQREWVEKIMIFHLIIALCIITGVHTDIVTKYADEEVMFRPMINQYNIQGSFVNIALTRPVHTVKSVVDRIANAITISNSVVITGEVGVGKKSHVLALAKHIILGNYPLLYNSIIVSNPSKAFVQSKLVEQNGNHIICVITDANSDSVITPNDIINSGISLSKRVRTIHIMSDLNTNPIGIQIRQGIFSAEIIEIESPKSEDIHKMLEANLAYIKKYMDISLDDEVIPYIVKAAERFDGESIQPTKSVNLMTEAIFDKVNNVLLNSNTIDIPISIEHGDPEAYSKILKKLESNTAYTMLRHSSIHVKITLADIEKFVVKRFNLTKEVLASLLSTNARQHLGSLREKILEKVYGQDEAVIETVKSLWRRALKIDVMDRPTSYLFIGATGTGKTYLSQCLADNIFGNSTYLKRFDMSEYMHSHEISKLIGSPPGYVGSTQSGRLTEIVSKNPYCVLLFDEVEKAHTDILNIFLQILDYGKMTDNHGKTVDFSKTIIIMTSNIGIEKLERENVVGFGQTKPNSSDKALLRKEAEDFFKPEFINRISRIIVFNNLTDSDFLRIIKTRLSEIQESCILDIKIDSNVEEELLKIAKKKPYNIEKYNARELKRVIVEHVENKIVDYASSNDNPKIKIFVGLEGGINICPQ